jgi:hypothetical protein
MRSLGTALNTSFQADRHGPSITMRSPDFRRCSNIPIDKHIDELTDLSAPTAENANLICCGGVSVVCCATDDRVGNFNFLAASCYLKPRP